jgi:hypothetical protein
LPRKSPPTPRALEGGARFGLKQCVTAPRFRIDAASPSFEATTVGISETAIGGALEQTSAELWSCTPAREPHRSRCSAAAKWRKSPCAQAVSVLQAFLHGDVRRRSHCGAYSREGRLLCKRPAAFTRCVAPAAVIRCCASVSDWLTPWSRSEANVPRQPLTEGEGSRPFARAPLSPGLQISLSPCLPVPCFRARASTASTASNASQGGPSLRSAVPQGQASSSLFRPALCAADAVLAFGCAPA